MQKEKKVVNQDQKLLKKKDKGKTEFKSKNQGCISGEFAGINCNLVFLILLLISCVFFDMSMYFRLKLCCLHFFHKL